MSYPESNNTIRRPSLSLPSFVSWEVKDPPWGIRACWNRVSCRGSCFHFEMLLQVMTPKSWDVFIPRSFDEPPCLLVSRYSATFCHKSCELEPRNIYISFVGFAHGGLRMVGVALGARQGPAIISIWRSWWSSHNTSQFTWSSVRSLRSWWSSLHTRS